MDVQPDFQVGSLGSLLIGLRSFYRGLGFQVELAYIRTGGECACGDELCSSSPHFVSDDIDRSQGVHLVMSAHNALATRDLRVLHGVLGRSTRVPILRHGGTGYIFVLDPENVPDLFPVIEPGVGLWISLPPQKSDDIVGTHGLPAWLTPLNALTGELPDVGTVFHPVVVSRWEQLRALGADLWERLCGDGALGLDEIIVAAAERIAIDNDLPGLVELLAAVCIGDMITLDRAHQLLEANEHLLTAEEPLVELLHRNLYNVLFGEDELDTGAITGCLTDAAMSLVDISEYDDEGEDSTEDYDGVSENDADDEEALEELNEFPPVDEDFATETEGVLADAAADAVTDGSLAPEIWSEPVFAEISGEDDELDEVAALALIDGGEEEKIDWVSAVDGWEGELSAPFLAMRFLGMTELGLTDDDLTKLALLDLAITALPSIDENLGDLLTCLWPSVSAFAADLYFHTLAVQLFAGMLLRFKMIGDAGMLIESPSLTQQLEAGGGAVIFSDLMGSPSILFWLERHILNTNTPALLAQRVSFVAEVLGMVRHGIIGSVSTSHFVELIGDDIDD